MIPEREREALEHLTMCVMSDYIKREDAIKLCIDIINYRTTEMINMGSVEPAERINVIELAYKKLPSADVIERADYEQLKFILDKQIEHGLAEHKRGEWIEINKEVISIPIKWGEADKRKPIYKAKFRCSECGFQKNFMDGHTAQYNFCPNCGADMRKGADDE